LTETPTPSGAPLRLPGLAAYGALRMPLALLELPLFVLLPAFYSERFGMALALIGAILFGTRLLDAIADPLIGTAIDHGGSARYRQWIWFSLAPLALGFSALFYPPVSGGALLGVWLALASMLTYLSYSCASIAYQAWGAGLGHSDRERAGVTGVRESFGLIGVVLASALLTPSGVPLLVAGFWALSAIAAISLVRAPAATSGQLPLARTSGLTLRATWASVSGNPTFRWLLAAFVINGIATAIPATLVLFFVGDVLDAESRIPLFLVSYFLAGALGMPGWVALAGRVGLRNAWLIGMGLAVIAFVWALGLGPGDVAAFWVICVLTGLALGADLAMPPALLAQAIAAHPASIGREGAYFGLWSLATKLNLAIAAGLALPLLGWLGYVPGQSGEAPLALSLAYAALPSLLKLAAGAVLLSAPSASPSVSSIRGAS
jgi:glycoside/pentoside/hexuronide:cation symporter, GPH family